MVKYASAAGATPQPPLPGAYSAPQTHSWTKEGNGREKEVMRCGERKTRGRWETGT